MNVELNDILVCHKLPYKYSGFEVGGRYKVLTHLTSKYDPDRDFVYILNDRYLSIRSVSYTHLTLPTNREV